MNNTKRQVFNIVAYVPKGLRLGLGSEVGGRGGGRGRGRGLPYYRQTHHGYFELNILDLFLEIVKWRFFQNILYIKFFLFFGLRKLGKIQQFPVTIVDYFIEIVIAAFHCGSMVHNNLQNVAGYSLMVYGYVRSVGIEGDYVFF